MIQQNTVHQSYQAIRLENRCFSLFFLALSIRFNLLSFFFSHSEKKKCIETVATSVAIGVRVLV